MLPSHSKSTPFLGEKLALGSLRPVLADNESLIKKMESYDSTYMWNLKCKIHEPMKQKHTHGYRR